MQDRHCRNMQYYMDRCTPSKRARHLEFPQGLKTKSGSITGDKQWICFSSGNQCISVWRWINNVIVINEHLAVWNDPFTRRCTALKNEASDVFIGGDIMAVVTWTAAMNAPSPYISMSPSLTSIPLRCSYPQQIFRTPSPSLPIQRVWVDEANSHEVAYVW